MTALQPPDPLSLLCHRLIEKGACDPSGPFLVHGHPNLPETPTRLIRSCFYYSVVMTPKVTLLLDNHGRGGMCDMDWDEVTAFWSTKDLLDAAKTTFEALRDGTASIDKALLVPAPIELAPPAEEKKANPAGP